MHIRNVRIDWMLKYDSNPFIVVDIDGYERPTFRYEAIPVGYCTFYHARVGDAVGGPGEDRHLCPSCAAAAAVQRSLF